MTPITSLPPGLAGNRFDVHSPFPADIEKASRLRGMEIPGEVGKTPAAHEPFGAMVERFVGDVDDKIQAAGNDQAKVLGGESTNLHQAMISMQEASVAFSLMIEVRNKLVESYQEMMRMQV